MSEEKKNEILEEQRRARQEFLDLKKMQHGEMKAPPKPSEIAIKPTTPKEKWANFWFQYKWYVLAITAITVVMAVLIAQCATRTDYDLEVVYFSYTPVMDEQTAPIGKYLETMAEDVNGDGEVHVQVVNCSFDNKNGGQYRYTMMTKLQAIIAGDQNALLFITDSASYDYLNGLSESGSIFEGEPLKLGEDFYTAVKHEQFGSLPEGLQISCRRVSDTVLEDKKNVEDIFEASQKIIEELKK